jgi:hypothetical protein
MPHVRSSVAVVPVALLAGCLLFASSAHAEKKRPNTVVLSSLLITGRIGRPLATVEVGRVAVSLTLSEPHPPFAENIATATQRQPF